MGAGFRCFCDNQMVVPHNIIASHSITHRGYTADKVKTAIHAITQDMPKMYDSIHGLQQTELDVNGKWMFAEMALDLLFSQDKWEKYDKQHTINRLLKSTRDADDEDTLFNVYNRVQERFLKGGRYLVPKENVEYCGKHYLPDVYIGAERVRKIVSIDRGVKVNKDLWSLAEQVKDITLAV